MKKYIKIIFASIITIILVIILISASNYIFGKTSSPKDEEPIYKEPKTKSKKLNSIQTPDKKITIDDTTAYYRDEITEIMLKIDSVNNYEELFLKLEFTSSNEIIDTKILHLTNVISNEKIDYMVQSTKDLTKINNWSVIIVDMSEASQEGYQNEENYY